MQIRADENFAKCGCGRSPTGKCIGWHGLPESEYKTRKDAYELAEYQKQAQDIWSDSCTTPRKPV